MLSQRKRELSGRSIPLWRNENTLRAGLQALFVLAWLLVGGFLYVNALHSLRELDLRFSYAFLGQEAGFGISEGIAYQPSDSYGRALWVGVVNTVRVTFFGILAASILGVVVGVARLSSNWLVRNLARLYVELFRNVPLLLQLLFWYTAVILKLPPVQRSLVLFDHIHFTQRGIYLPRPVAGDGFAPFGWSLAAACVASAGMYLYRRRRLRMADRPGFPFLGAAAVFLLVAATGWIAAPGAPIEFDTPVLGRFNFTGGARLSPEFSALFFGLSVYTGAFIAEVVRGGIQSVEKGQQEAALALGLTPFQVMYLVVLPQALRVIVPPVTSQYLNLAKNSSLAVVIGYPELFNIGTTTMNQTGQTLPVFSLIVLSYLALSLATSAFMNWYNRSVRLVER